VLDDLSVTLAAQSLIVGADAGRIWVERCSADEVV
jgi:hypothetical protein